MIEKMKIFLKNFWQKKADLILSLFFLDYVFLFFLEHAIPGIVTKKFNLYWLVFFLVLFLFFREKTEEKNTSGKIVLQDSPMISFLVLLSFFSLIFLGWWAVNLQTALVFSLFSFLLVFLFGYFWQK